ncbi:TadE/TadG family type IV pilus assembly protein [Sanguibacter antarcticus]|uniref:TadE-like protein n=1 Tax=Sanguibacter antarcticus TaxID=372484 RepID=A0A2A9E8Y4_9MICO|nr:TadE/TadG family type IV pilus assembly protein [Sanguibacter antarcticus]PFG34689.1 TadE-like protein [Sanguibacter antarcticus]
MREHEQGDQHEQLDEQTSREAGQVALELVGVVTLVVLAAMLCVQGVYVAQVYSTTQAAVRDAARIEAEGEPGRPALDARLPDWIRVERYVVQRNADDVEVQVAVRLPVLGPSVTVGGLLVERSATFPRMDS